jgi:cyclic pyranopterin phosphate synthase
MSPLTHLDEKRQAHMVTVSTKAETQRGAVARAEVSLSEEGFVAVRDASGPKGDAVQVARLAGIQGTKRTAELIPLCHPLRITRVAVEATLDEAQYRVIFEVTVEAVDRTGVEMEALTGASIAALTLYDMIKAVDRSAVIGPIRLLEKWGGKSGHFKA